MTTFDNYNTLERNMLQGEVLKTKKWCGHVCLPRVASVLQHVTLQVCWSLLFSQGNEALHRNRFDEVCLVVGVFRSEAQKANFDRS